MRAGAKYRRRRPLRTRRGPAGGTSGVPCPPTHDLPRAHGAHTLHTEQPRFTRARSGTPHAKMTPRTGPAHHPHWGRPCSPFPPDRACAFVRHGDAARSLVPRRPAAGGVRRSGLVVGAGTLRGPSPRRAPGGTSRGRVRPGLRRLPCAEGPLRGGTARRVDTVWALVTCYLVTALARLPGTPRRPRRTRPAQPWYVMYPLPSRSLAVLVYAWVSAWLPDGLYR